VKSDDKFAVALTRKSLRACFVGLPDELVLSIFQKLPGDSLAHLCQVNRRYQSIAEECLYEHVYYHGQDSVMIEAIAKRPHLRAFIKLWDAGYNHDHNHTDEHTAILRGASNIRRLEVTHRSQPGSSFVELLHDAVSSPTKLSTNTFTTLQYLSIFSKGSSNIHDMAPVFYLPALRTLKIVYIRGRLSEQHWSVPEAVSSIKELKLDSCFLDSKLVAKIVNSIKALEVLEYVYQPLRPRHDPCINNTWADIASSLQKHTRTLSALQLIHFDGRAFWKPVVSDEIKHGTVGSLQEFTQPKSLSVQIQTLLELQNGDDDLAQKLPNGLEHLNLWIEHPKRHEAQLYRNALSSLKVGVFTGATKSIHGVISDSVPLRELRLASVFESLEQAGIYICIGGCGGSWRTFHAKDLREMEADDYEEEPDTSDESDDYDEYSDLELGTDFDSDLDPDSEVGEDMIGVVVGNADEDDEDFESD
jgi:hypothetical protein